jgi:hypothetical protein
MLGDWMRRVSGGKRLVPGTTTESARESWYERCGALTPISCGEKFELVAAKSSSPSSYPPPVPGKKAGSELLLRALELIREAGNR